MPKSLPGGRAGRVFLVPVSSLVSLAALGIFIFWSKQHLFRLSTGIWPFLSNTSGLPDWIVSLFLLVMVLFYLHEVKILFSCG